MKLITEYVDQNIDYLISEDKDSGKKNFFIEGVFMQSDTKNRNQRIYPKTILENAVTKYHDSQIINGRAVGELNHPPTPTINLDRVSHSITELRFEGNEVHGRAKILDTQMGLITKGLIEGGVKLGVSSRGVGTLTRKNGVNIVNDDYVINSIDVVHEPSCEIAMVNGIYEGAEWIFDSMLGDWRKEEAISDIQKELKRKKINEKIALYQLKRLWN